MPTFLNPVAGTIYPYGAAQPAGAFVVTSPFGPRTAPFSGFHDGIDIANEQCGDPVYSSAAGTVLNSGIDTDGAVFGIIQHPDDYQSWYWHLTAEWLTNGFSIGAGVQLGTVGSTGNSTACHLHFTIKQLVNGVYVAVDPWPLLAQNGGNVNLTTYFAAEMTLGGAPLENGLVPVRATPSLSGALAYALTPAQGRLLTIGAIVNAEGTWYPFWDAAGGKGWCYVHASNVPILTKLTDPASNPPADCSAQNAQIAQLHADLTAANTKIATAKNALG